MNYTFWHYMHSTSSITYPWYPNTGVAHIGKRLYDKEQRPKTLSYNGKQWVNKPLDYYPIRGTTDIHLKLTHLPAEILDIIFSYLDVQSLYNVCQMRVFKPFLNDYNTLKRFLNQNINDDLTACRWELVVFKHNHGIKCGYRTSQKAMALATSKRQWEFCIYLNSVGKSWNWQDLSKVLNTREHLVDFLKWVKPHPNKTPTLLYVVLNIALKSNDPAMISTMEKYFRNKIKTEINAMELVRITGNLAPQYIKDESEAKQLFLNAKTIQYTAILQKFPNLWNDREIKYCIFRDCCAHLTILDCQYPMSYDDWVIVMQAGNVDLLCKAPSVHLVSLIEESLQTTHRPCLDKLLSLYLRNSESISAKSKANALIERHPELSGHSEIKRARNWIYRLF